MQSTTLPPRIFTIKQLVAEDFPLYFSPILKKDEQKKSEGFMRRSDRPAKTEQEFENWYASANQEQIRQACQEKFENLPEDTKKRIAEQYNKKKNKEVIVIREGSNNNWWFNDPFFIYLIFLSSPDIDYLCRGIYELGHGISHVGSGIGSDSGKGDVETVVAAGSIATILSALVAGSYAMKKTYNSIRNIGQGIHDITQGEKPSPSIFIKSLFRLGGIAGGTYAGIVSGAIIGAAAGSVFPIVGTVVGAIVGSVLFGLIGAGVGALVSKYTAKGVTAAISYAKKDENILDGSSVSMTNPGKYQISKKQMQNITTIAAQAKIVTSDQAIYSFLSYVRKVKNDSILGSLPFTHDRKKKELLNTMIKAVKEGKLMVNNTGQLFYKNNKGEWSMFLKEKEILKNCNVEKLEESLKIVKSSGK